MKTIKELVDISVDAAGFIQGKTKNQAELICIMALMHVGLQQTIIEESMTKKVTKTVLK